MKKLGLFVLIFTFFIVSNSNAQKIGVIAGADLSTFTNPSSLTDYTYTPGLNLSFAAQKKLFPMFAARGIVGLEQKGFYEKNYSITTNINYAQLSLNMVFKPLIPVYAVAGPYFSYGISGKQEIAGISTDVTFGDNGYLPYDYGTQIGIGYLQKLPLSVLFLEAKYELGFANIANSKVITEQNRTILISLGFLFGLK